MLRVPFCTALVLSILSCDGSPSPSDKGQDSDSGGGEEVLFLVDDAISLTRDTQGVAHVSALTRRGMFYGYGYASAQDRMFQMDYFRRKAGGRLAEFLWIDGEDDYNQGLLDSDIEYRTVGTWAHAQTVVEQLPDEAALDLKSYADGVNAYLKGLQEIPTLYKLRGITEIERWTEADSLLVWDHIWVYTGRPGTEIRNEIEAWIDCADPTSEACVPTVCESPDEPPVDGGAAIVPEEVSGNYVFSTDGESEPLPRPPDRSTSPEVTFSHGWVVAGTRTTTGKPVIAFDPKIPVWAPSLFYPFHITGPDHDVRGMGFAGAPAGFAYWNQHLGQTVTAAHGDTLDLFSLVSGSDDDHYMLDGAEVAFKIREEEIALGDGTTYSLQVKETVWGPVINEIPALLAHDTIGPELEDSATPLFAARMLEQSRTETHSLVAHMGAMEATNLADYRTAIEEGVTPYVHALYAGVDADDPDGDGHIAYHPSAGIPRRVSLEIGGLDYTGQHPYDGSDSSNDWTGMLSIDERPYVIDPSSGYLLAANNLTVGSWYTDHIYGGFHSSTGDTFRGGILRYQLGEMFPDENSTVEPRVVHELHNNTSSNVTDGLREIYTHIIDDLEAYGEAPAQGQEVGVDGSIHDKAHKVRQALDAYHNQGTGFLESNPYEDLVRWVTQRLKNQAAAGKNLDVYCAWNKSETAANWIIREARSDPAAFMEAHPEFVQDYFLDVAEDIYDSMISEGDWQDDDVSTWVADEPLEFDIAFGYMGTHCMSPTGTDDAPCSLDESYVIHHDELQHRNKNLIVSSSDGSMPATVDFADVDAAVWLFPIGVSEDPLHWSFDSFYEDWLVYANDASDASAYSNAPLSRDLIEVDSFMLLSYWSN